MILEQLSPTDGSLPGELLTELTSLYAANREFFALSGDFPNPDDIRPEQVEEAEPVWPPDLARLLDEWEV
ncbi:hypothetical protein AQI88_29950 [Streptomyces cellostaticus]|uniref:Uncharacterized protein n=1 Tax=Streptomyces cellostaticus TaxID=67285 RepID=A0A117PUT1_9ACTN|nr:hypothetical protein [Streptomyces cellostaticus]KUM92783.1 hypothetical protein AQI88_29950 [Streptomyces cellostaticus]GHI06795.1 hypothetical protein Scel_51160 [Streptomyces cellostaticus]